MEMSSRVINLFITAGEGNRLERDRLNLVDIANCKINDRADIVVVDVIQDRVDQSNLHSGLGHVFDRLELHIEQVTDIPMRILFFRRAIELKVGSMKTGILRFLHKLGTLCEAAA
jgi:hypothetical protein